MFERVSIRIAATSACGSVHMHVLCALLPHNDRQQHCTNTSETGPLIRMILETLGAWWHETSVQVHLKQDH